MTKYIGKGTDYYIPNAASFRAAGKITANQKVFATYKFLHALYNGDTSAAEVTPNGAATSISVQRAENAADRVVLLGYPDSDESSTTQHANDLFSPGDDNVADGNMTLKTLDLAGLDVSQLTDMSTMIANDKALTSVTGLDTWQFNPHNYSVRHLFAYDDNLKTIDGINNWDTSNFRYIDNMFNGDTSLTGNIDLSKWNTQNVILAGSMFKDASVLTSVGDLSGWRLTNATDTSYMFAYDNNITSLGNLDNWGMQSVTNTSYMFMGDSKLTSVGDLSKWWLPNVTNTTSMFSNDSKLVNLGNLDNWGMGKDTSMDNMFSYDPLLTNIGNIGKWDVSNVTTMYAMFEGDHSLTSVGDLSNWQLQNVTNTSHMFEDDNSLTSVGDLSKWRLTNVTNTSYMFSNDSKLANLGNLDNWGMGKDTNMAGMFVEDELLTNIGDLSKWQLSNVTDTSCMFEGDHSLTSVGDLSNWQLQNVTDTSSMFSEDYKLTSLGDLSNWRLTNVTNTMSMFADDSKLTDLGDLDNWGMGKNTNMAYMFGGDYLLTNIGNIGNWDVSNVTNMQGLFKGDYSLTTPGDLSNWNTNKVTDMSEMFWATHYLTSVGDLSKWNQSGLLEYTYNMFEDSGIKQVNVSGWKFAPRGEYSQGHNRVSGMFTSLFNPATIIANNWSTALPLTADDFVGDQPLIVISNNLTALNNEKLYNGTTGHAANTVTFVDASDQTKGRASQQQNFVFASTDALKAYLANIKTNANLATVNVNVDGTSNKLSNVITDGSDAVYLNGKHNATGTAYDGDYGLIAGTYEVTGKTEYLKKDQVTRTFRIIEKLPTGNKTIWTLNTTQYKIATKNDLTGAISDYKYQDPSGCGNDQVNSYNMFGNNNNFRHGTVVGHSDEEDRTMGFGDYDLAPAGYTINLNESSLPGRDSPIHISYDQAQHTYGVDIYWGGQPMDSFPESQDFYIDYVANPQKVIFKFVDDDKNGDPVGSDIKKTGQTDQTIDTGLALPAGYKLATGQNLPATYKFTANTDQEDVIHLVHATVTVTPDNPKTTADKLPDNPDKNYPTGVAKDDLNKTLTRTIKFTEPNGTVVDKSQTLSFTRTATIDELTGEVTSYSNWVPVGGNKFAQVDAPAVPGYTPEQASIAETDFSTQDAINGWADPNLKIGYTANNQHVTVQYKDGDKVIASQEFDGKTDQTITLTFDKVPANYDVDGKLPDNSYKFKADGNQVITINLKHQTENITEHKTITRTITIVAPNGNETTEPQPVTLTRTNVLDKVTNHVTDGTWDTGSFAEYDVPAIAGYTPSQAKVEAQDVDENTQDSTVTINYTANDQKVTFKFVDDDNNGAKVGSDIVETGKTDQTIDPKLTLPDNYKLADGQNLPTSYTFKADDNQVVTINLKHQTENVTEHKTVKRTINVITPDGKTKTITVQNANPNRTNVRDKVTHKIIANGDWNKDHFGEFADIPAIPGYTPSQTKVEAQDVDENTQDSTVNITYTANNQKVTFKFVDDNNNGDQVASIEKTGKTDQTINPDLTVPGGYKLANNQKLPANYQFTADTNQEVVIHLVHATVTVTPDNPKTTADKLPDNSDKNYPTGVAKDDLNKTVTRTIIINNPHTGKSTQTQPVTFTRTATVDEVNGNVTYGQWDKASYELAAVTVPEVAGYTASGTVDQEVVTPDSKDSTVNITYTANDQKVTFKFVDDNNNGDQVASIEKTGKTDQTINPDLTVPGGYKLATGQILPATYKFKADANQEDVIHLVHATVTVTPDNPKTTADTLPDNPGKNYPSGVAKDDLNKTLTRTIKFELPNGRVVDKTQQLNFKRTATIDESNDKVTYSDWMPVGGDKFTQVDAPVVPGYTPSQKSVDATSALSQDEINNWTDPNLDITYTANDQKVFFKFVDDDNNGDKLLLSRRLVRQIRRLMIWA